MSKAETIRNLLAHGLDYAEIAEKVGCRVEYVRATASRQRLNYATDAAYQRKCLDAGRRVPGALDAARAAARQAYRDGRDRGGAYQKVLLRAGRNNSL